MYLRNDFFQKLRTTIYRNFETFSVIWMIFVKIPNFLRYFEKVSFLHSTRVKWLQYFWKYRNYGKRSSAFFLCYNGKVDDFPLSFSPSTTVSRQFVGNMKNTPDVLVTRRKAIFLFTNIFRWAVPFRGKNTTGIFSIKILIFLHYIVLQFVIFMSDIKIVNGLS